MKLHRLIATTGVCLALLGCESTSTTLATIQSSLQQDNEVYTPITNAVGGELYFIIPTVKSPDTKHFASIFAAKEVDTGSYGVRASNQWHVVGEGATKPVVGEKIEQALSNTEYSLTRMKCQVTGTVIALSCPNEASELEYHQLSAKPAVYSKANRTILRLRYFEETDHIAPHDNYPTLDPQGVLDHINPYQLTVDIPSRLSPKVARERVSKRLTHKGEAGRLVSHSYIQVGKQSFRIDYTTHAKGRGSVISYTVHIPPVIKGKFVHYNEQHASIMHRLRAISG